MNVSLLKFQHQGPLSDEVLRAHVEHSYGLGFEEAFPRKRLSIVANGPSARHATIPAGDILALNGALGLCLSRGFAPTFWAACDPQALVLDFLQEVPFGITYLLASKCHESVFARLRSRDTRIFHVGDTPSPGLVSVRHGSSITLTALHLARMLSYSDIDVYGWDCCLLQGEHHGQGSAAPQEIINLDIRQAPEALPFTMFKTTHTWASEVDQALGHITELRAWGVDVKVHGPGMLRAALDFLQSLENENGCG